MTDTADPPFELGDPLPTADPSIAYDLAKSDIELQFGTIDALDTKLSQSLALASALVGIQAAIVALNPGSAWSLQRVLLMVGSVLYVPIAMLVIRAIWTHAWDMTPNVTRVIAHLKEGVWVGDSLRWLVTEGLIRNHQNNQTRVKAKARALRAALILVAIQVGALVATALAIAF